VERILIVSGGSKMRACLERLLDRLDVVVTAIGDVEVATDQIRSRPPALVVLDADSGGLEFCREICDHSASTSVVMVSEHPREPTARIAALLAGADDYLSGPYDADELLARIRRMLDRRRQWLGLSSPRSTPLSPRESEVLELLAAGRSAAEIASELVISHKTVATHIQHILTKLGVHSQAQAVAHAHIHHLVDAHDAHQVERSAAASESRRYESAPRE
jgi:DNA-binding NarL/FixJ family response regulator